MREKKWKVGMRPFFDIKKPKRGGRNIETRNIYEVLKDIYWMRVVDFVDKQPFIPPQVTTYII